MSVEPGVLDANILVYAFDFDAPQHAACRALLNAARDPSTNLFVTSQILAEVYSIVTNPRRVAVARSPIEALRALSALLAYPGIHVLPAPARVAIGWMELVEPVTGGAVFDLQIVATMKANNVERIYTFNTEDFEAFSELAVVAPSC
jgi:predicted nucleic acid-binding protein